MANPAKEARDKAQAQWPGASVHSRGHGWIKHQHPTEPDRFILDSHIGPIHYGVGDDQEIDTAWQVTTGAWQYEMTTNGFQTYARDTFNVGDIFEFQKDGEWLRFDPQSINWIDENTSRQQIAIKQAVTAVVTDDILRFPNAYGAGRHFQYQNQTARLQKLLTIDSASDLPEPTVQGNEVWFEVEFSLSLSSGINFWIDGVEWARANAVRIQTADRIEIRSSDGTQVLWWLGLPRAWDSSGDNETIGQLEVRRQGGPTSLFITVRIPKTWIDSAVFPIYIDPTIDEQVAAGADDGYQNDIGSLAVITSNVYFIRATSGGGYRVYGAALWAITGPASADTIDVAYVSLFHTVATLDVNIDFEDVDNAAALAATLNNLTDRTLTGNAVRLNVDTSASQFDNSPSMVTALQDVIDRAGWSSGNNIVAVYQGASATAGTVGTYESLSTWAPKIHIEYTAGAGGISIPVAMHHYRQQGMA